LDRGFDGDTLFVTLGLEGSVEELDLRVGSMGAWEEEGEVAEGHNVRKGGAGEEEGGEDAGFGFGGGRRGHFGGREWWRIGCVWRVRSGTIVSV
jgi:hypothetical protein